MSKENVASNPLGRDIENADIDAVGETRDPTDSDVNVESKGSETQVETQAEESVPEAAQPKTSSKKTLHAPKSTQAYPDQDTDTPQDIKAEKPLNTADTADTALAETQDAAQEGKGDTPVVDVNDAETVDSAPDDFEPPAIAPVPGAAEVKGESGHVHSAGSPAKTYKKHPILAAGIAAVGALLLVGVATGGGAWFFKDHAKPGFHLMGEPVTGLSATEVATLAADLSSEYSVTFQMGDVLVTATPSDAGISINTDSTVDSVMEPRANRGFLSLYNPFVAKDVPLSLSVDQAKLQAYLDDTFISPDKRQVPAEVTFDEGAGLFALIPAVDGIQADAASVAQQLESGIGLNDPIEVPTVVEAPFIKNETIQKAVDDANTRLTAGYTFTANGLSYTVPSATVRGWIDIVINKEAGTATLTYKEEALKQELDALINENLAANGKDTHVLVGPEGQHLAVVQQGVDGTTVTDMDSITKATFEALKAGTPLDLPVAVDIQISKEVPVPMDPQYTVPNGEKWIELNLTAFTATRWEGTTKLNTYIVALGRLDTPTRPGIFHVWSKLASQDMYGDDDGVPWRYDGVPWISYFDGGRAFHGVYWHVAFGSRASHGCAGMWIDDAKQLWEWDEVGTMVVVHY